MGYSSQICCNLWWIYYNCICLWGKVLLDTSSGRFFDFVLTSCIGFLKKKNQNQRTPSYWFFFKILEENYLPDMGF